MSETAAKLRVSRRWLQGFIQDHPFYRLAGTKKLFTDEDINRLIEVLPCHGHSSRPVRRTRNTTTSEARIAQSDSTTALELARSGRPSGSLRARLAGAR